MTPHDAERVDLALACLRSLDAEDEETTEAPQAPQTTWPGFGDEDAVSSEPIEGEE
tara:strand:- start:103 stop:270 length:168 start_codon:yes stop_codon:yes gene_type:complete